MPESFHTVRDLTLLEEIERDPDTTQATLASRLGVAVGTVNWHLKRLISKGYVKVKRAERRKLRYIITPEGLSLRARLTVRYIEDSMTLYRESRKKAQQALRIVRREGYDAVRIEGEGDIADIVRLTCLEQGLKVVEDSPDGFLPALVVQGREISLRERRESVE